jgi:hypothetical protein
MSKSEHYDIRVQGTSRFSVRKAAATKVGARSRSWVHLTVTSGRKLLFKDWHQLQSGLEVYGPAITASLKPRTRIHVEVHT